MRKIKVLAAAAVCLCIAFGAAGCGNGDKQPVTDIKTENNEKNGEKNESKIPGGKNNAKDTPKDSLTELRQSLKDTGCMAAVAYLGFADEAWIKEEGLESFLLSVDADIIQDMTFINDIPEERIIGKAGDLYCIVPAEGTDIAINSIEWDYDPQGIQVGEVLYKSESGEPILLFCNEYNYYDGTDVQVNMVSGDGKTCQWYPIFSVAGELNLPVNNEGECALKDFTYYPDYTISFDDWINEGWFYPTEDNMKYSTWIYTEYTPDGTETGYSLCLNDSSDGGAVLYYDFDGYSMEIYNGTWVLEKEDGITYLALELNRTDTGLEVLGDSSDNIISGRYPVIISPEDDMMVMGYGGEGSVLPFQRYSLAITVLFRAFG